MAMKSADEIGKYRLTLQQEAGKLIGVKYKYGAEWTDRSKMPEFLDCSEFIEGIFAIACLAMPDGGIAQFAFTTALADALKPQVGDLGFFRKDGVIHHVGMIYDANQMIEARGFDPKATFKTGEVILRPISKWTAYKDFAGFRVHPELWTS